jgi:phosphoribosylformylglycinamidine synthase
VSTDGNGRRCALDPRVGTARLVHEAALNVAVTGAKPMCVVNNLNFGSPEDPEVMWQFAEAVAGMAEACEALGIPVVGGNVSFYNETAGPGGGSTAIHPTPVVGVLGLADPIPDSAPRLDRAETGMELWLIGPDDPGDLSASAYAASLGLGGGRPAPADAEASRRVIDLCVDLAHEVAALHDISQGGLAVALAEVCIRSGVGATAESGGDRSACFSEGPHRVLAVSPPDADVAGRARAAGVPAVRIGVMGGDDLVLGGDTVALAEAVETWRRAIPRRMH